MTKDATTPHPAEAAASDETPLNAREALERALELYSPTVVERWVRPRNRGAMKQPDGLGRAASDCQDTIEIYLRVRHERITGISFLSTGCGSTLASASMATELADGKTLTEAMSITAADILTALDGLPEHNAHCADMAASALRQAAQDALRLAREPWKKLYR